MMTKAEEKENLIRNYQHAFGGVPGGEVLRDLEKFCMLNSTTFVPGKADLTAFNEGARSVGLYIKAKLSVDLSKAQTRKNNTEG